MYQYTDGSECTSGVNALCTCSVELASTRVSGFSPEKYSASSAMRSAASVLQSFHLVSRSASIFFSSCCSEENVKTRRRAGWWGKEHLLELVLELGGVQKHEQKLLWVQILSSHRNATVATTVATTVVRLIAMRHTWL
eukprot:SAG31_NODE_10731_length_1104_cov_1.274627_1_plen_138_part_10